MNIMETINILRAINDQIAESKNLYPKNPDYIGAKFQAVKHISVAIANLIEIGKMEGEDEFKFVADLSREIK